jgi:hypothetical protein
MPLTVEDRSDNGVSEFHACASARVLPGLRGLFLLRLRLNSPEFVRSEEPVTFKPRKDLHPAQIFIEEMPQNFLEYVPSFGAAISATVTCAPLSRKAFAKAPPIPPVPPVIRTRFPRTLKSGEANSALCFVARFLPWKRSAPITQRCFAICSAMYSAWRIASATIVRVGFAAAPVVN